MKLQVIVKNVYGNPLVYPYNELAKQFASLTGTKTFNHSQMCNLERICQLAGWVFEDVTPVEIV